MAPEYETAGQRTAFHALIGRALVDPEFRAALNSDGRIEALKSMGIEPTDDVLKALGGAMGSVDDLAKQLGDFKAAT